MCLECEIYTDLASHSGLSKIEAQFDAIYAQLDCAFYTASNELTKGGIIDIYAKFCASPTLRNKLFERGTHTSIDRAFS